jgi:succinate dehydrogenase / fumarate reductase cytochrome b subunit
MKQIQPRQNYLGTRGWAWAGKYKAERYLYLFHRLTGVGMLLFVMIHLVATTIFRIQGQDVWESTMALLNNPALKIGEFLVVIAFIFHGINGIRLAKQELGFGLGKPTPPIYPYKDALRKKRPGTYIMVALIVIITGVFLIDFFVGGL